MTKGTLLASCAVIAMAAVAARASAQSTWSENAGDPVHVPYVGMSSYYPSVVLDVDQFSGHGAPAYFKMWHQGPGGIALSTSNDGVNWTLAGITNLGESYHPCVVYDADGFGGGAHTYRIWFWTGTAAFEGSTASSRTSRTMRATRFSPRGPFTRSDRSRDAPPVTGSLTCRGSRTTRSSFAGSGPTGQPRV